MMNDFLTDSRLENDTVLVEQLDICDLRLMDDERWPWLILVPRIQDAVEWHELYADQRQDIDMEISQVSGLLKAVTGCEKINIAALGNAVRQLHIHIIARHTGDPNWPGPVWGYGDRIPMDAKKREQLAISLRTALNEGF